MQDHYFIRHNSDSCNSVFPGKISSQVSFFTRQDTLRGSITPERAWWDLTYYHLDITVNPADSTIHGTNTVTYRVFKPSEIMQIDLQEPLDLTQRSEWKNPEIQKGGKCITGLNLQENRSRGKYYSVVLTYGGKPKISERPPWSGGITWAKDSNRFLL